MASCDRRRAIPQCRQSMLPAPSRGRLLPSGARRRALTAPSSSFRSSASPGHRRVAQGLRLSLRHGRSPRSRFYGRTWTFPRIDGAVGRGRPALQCRNAFARLTPPSGGSFAPSPLSTTLKIPYSMSGGGGGSVEALQAATIADAAMDRKKRARALQGHERACTSPTRQDAAHAQTGEIPAWSRVGRFALVYARRTVT